MQSRTASRSVERSNRFAGVAEGAGLAHDAGNLLSALSLYSELLARPGVLHEEHREFASELRLLSDRSWAMIDRLVNHARIERAESARMERAVLPEVVERCRGMLSRVAGRRVKVSYGPGAYELIAVREEAIERILTNLVKNAAEAMVGEDCIRVKVEAVGNGIRRQIVMSVRDTGCGMSSAAVRRLMQTGGISTVSGRGMGFRVVRELVAISGGCLSVESQPGVGTDISVIWECSDGIDDLAMNSHAKQ